MSEMVRAMVRVGASQMEMREYPMPDVPEDAALMKVVVAGICGTDVKMYKKPQKDEQVIMGHENIGYIAKAGGCSSRRLTYQLASTACRVTHRSSTQATRSRASTATRRTLWRWHTTRPRRQPTRRSPPRWPASSRGAASPSPWTTHMTSSTRRSPGTRS